MEITYFGKATFFIKSDAQVAINPNQSPDGGVVVLYSTRQRSARHIVNGPGEYELGGVLIATVETGEGASRSLAHSIDLSGLNLVHLGTFANALIARDLETLGKPDILIVPADDLAAATEAVARLDPRVVLPFGAHAALLCEQRGIKETKPENRFSWNGVTAPPRAILLKAAVVRGRAA